MSDLVSTEKDQQSSSTLENAMIDDSVIMSFVNGGTINGYKFSHPLPPLTQPGSGDLIKTCNPNYWDECLHIKKYLVGQTVRLLILSGTEFGIEQPAHVFHLHGHTMKLSAEGFAEVDTMSKLSIEAYPDLEIGYANITSSGGLLARSARLSENFSSNNSNFISNGVSKDSWLVPSGGWKLVEVTFNNPGLYLAHCHMTTHSMGGMTMMFQVGEEINFPLPNSGWPRCGNFVQDGGFSDFVEFQNYFESFPRKETIEQGN